MNVDNGKSFSYTDAGVSIEHGNKLVDRIKNTAASTMRQGVMGGLGGFGALFDIAALGYKHPVLVSGADGVGTKIKLAIEANRHATIGIDLVAMCANDIIVQGAEPLFFLDYFASSRLDLDVAGSVITGIASGCRLAGCSLIGGETAEMPDMYAAGDYDLAGFCVGVVERHAIIDGSTVNIGDALIALPSSGCHANGYSLIRKIIAATGQGLDQELDGRPLIDCLLEPTRIYVKTILKLISRVPVKAMAHITGGGITENIPRVIPAGYAVDIYLGNWSLPPVFRWLQESGNIEQAEMLKTFNCGAGLIICVARQDLDRAMEVLKGFGEQAWYIGDVVQASDRTVPVNAINRRRMSPD